MSFVCKVHEIGNDRTKVLVIDDAFPNYIEVRQRAQKEAKFFRPPSNYPGLNARAIKPYGQELLGIADRLVQEYFPMPRNFKLRPLVAYYGHITIPPSELNVKQCLPHFDSQLPTTYAAVHYLSEGDHGGTGFYRHALTGIECITEDRFSEFRETTFQHIAKNGRGKPGYLTGSHELFELIGQIDYKPNRLLIYPGSLLHTPMVNPETDISTANEKKRMTGNAFFIYSDKPIGLPGQKKPLS